MFWRRVSTAFAAGVEIPSGLCNARDFADDEVIFRAPLRGENSALRVVRHLSRAIQPLRPHLTPERYLETAGELAARYCELAEWHAAADVFENMPEAFEILWGDQITLAGRRDAAGHSQLARWAAYAVARSGGAARAVGILEQGRGELGTAVRREQEDLERLTAVAPELAEAYSSALATYRGARLAHDSRDEADLSGVADAEQVLRQAIAEVRGHAEFPHTGRPSDR